MVTACRFLDSLLQREAVLGVWMEIADGSNAYDDVQAKQARFDVRSDCANRATEDSSNPLRPMSVAPRSALPPLCAARAADAEEASILF